MLKDKIPENDPNEANTLNASIDIRPHTEPWPLPVCFKISTSIELIGPGDRVISSESTRLLLALNGEHPNDDSEKLNLGFEYAFKDLLFLRSGYSTGYDLPELSYEAGIKLIAYGRNLSIDYSFTPYGESEEYPVIHNQFEF